jgi:hypothetical protein
VSKRALIVEGNFHPRFHLPVLCSSSFHMHCPCYMQAQVTLGLGVGFALLMSWSSVKLAKRYVSHAFVSTHVSTRLEKKLPNMHDNRIHKFCHSHPFYNLESSTDSLVSKRALAMDGKFHLRLHLPVPYGKEEAITFSLSSLVARPKTEIRWC